MAAEAHHVVTVALEVGAAAEEEEETEVMAVDEEVCHLLFFTEIKFHVSS